MKAQLFDSKGGKKTQIELPELFTTKIREDMVLKYFEADKFKQPNSLDPEAGKKHSASGKIRHRRHRWGSHYGRGIARLPRKTLWRRGTQFYWIGAEVSGTRGGRVAHPPKGIGKEKKINKKEIKLAMNSAMAATASKDFVVSRYVSLDKIDAVPAIIESLPEKTKALIESLRKIFGNAFDLVLKKKTVRAGIGKRRNRKYKSNAGLLLVVGKDEKAKFSGIDVRSTDNVTIADFVPLGRLTLYTKKALEELEGKKESKKEAKKEAKK